MNFKWIHYVAMDTLTLSIYEISRLGINISRNNMLIGMQEDSLCLTITRVSTAQFFMDTMKKNVIKKILET